MRVTCPCPCGISFEAKRSNHGASYVHEWLTLPDANMRLLTWLINNHPNDWWEKSQIAKEYIFTTPDPLSARISELYGLDIIEQRRIAKSKQQTEAAYDGPAVVYRLNLIKASQVINSGGKLLDNFRGAVLA